ncbi:hypothetical protein [Actinomadura madurae]|uniref:hypothetical protein n=1 Tax=Actinomadura madurae TaxID=1993 RepID=UPI0020D21DC1|nr:hypothetical protein [Actinomadura madurae]MCP9979432.1 hypothetical protein [Actinomadura madurae]
MTVIFTFAGGPASGARTVWWYPWLIWEIVKAPCWYSSYSPFPRPVAQPDPGSEKSSASTEASPDVPPPPSGHRKAARPTARATAPTPAIRARRRRDRYLPGRRRVKPSFVGWTRGPPFGAISGMVVPTSPTVRAARSVSLCPVSSRSSCADVGRSDGSLARARRTRSRKGDLSPSTRGSPYTVL